MISRSYEDLSQALRMYLEAVHKAHSNLLFVDRDEAIGNMDLCFSAILNSIHSLYDAATNSDETFDIGWYSNPAICFTLIIRNAKHHNHANRIRSLYKYHVETSSNPADMKSYILVDFNANEEGYHTDHYLSWSDIKSLLNANIKETRIKKRTREMLYDSINLKDIESLESGSNTTSIFINFIPIIINALATITPAISDFIKPKSIESETFKTIFTTSKGFDLSSHILNQITVFLPD